MENIHHYRIYLQGKLDPEWSSCFNGLVITFTESDPPQTILAGPVRDQAALRGLLNKFWDLNLELVSLNIE